MSKDSLELAAECGASLVGIKRSDSHGILRHSSAIIFPSQESLDAFTAGIWKQVVEEWEKPWGLSNGESFEVRMRRKAGERS